MAKKRKRSRKARPESQPQNKRSQASHAKASASGTARAPAAPRRASGKARKAAGRSPLELALLALTGLGIVLTGYLTYVAWFGDHPAYCSEGSSCDIVQSSRWSRLLGVPLTVWGLLTYAVLYSLVWRLPKRPALWRVAFAVAMVALAISLYLTAVSVFAIDAVCLYCLGSLALIAAIFLVLALRRPAGPAFAWPRTLATGVGAAAVTLLTLHLYWSGVFDPGAGPEQPRLRALAMHLSDSGARFYGAYWCPRCQNQKEMFEASANRLPYVECSPQGRNGPQNTACLVENIRDYPTWVIDGERHTGSQTIATLARLSGFEWSGDGGAGNN